MVDGNNDGYNSILVFRLQILSDSIPCGLENEMFDLCGEENINHQINSRHSKS